MDPLHLSIALSPLAVYFVLLGIINLSARPQLTTGARDTAALAVGLSGLVVVGPMELFLPERAAAQFGGAFKPWARHNHRRTTKDSTIEGCFKGFQRTLSHAHIVPTDDQLNFLSISELVERKRHNDHHQSLQIPGCLSHSPLPPAETSCSIYSVASVQ